MNPFEVLGVSPSSPIDDIEATYRRLLRAHHPDLHHDASAAELAEAENRTRQLNQAMALIRAGWRPLPGSAAGYHYDDRTWGRPAGSPRPARPAGGPQGERWDHAYRVDPDTDWFGNPYRERRGAESVDCPLCGQVFDDPVLYRSHLQHDHRLADGAFPVAPQPRADRLRWLTWVPAPTLIFFALLVVYWMVVVALVDWPWTIAGIWIGVVLFGLTLNKAVRDRHRW
jgi:hypothetical protein